MKHSFTCALITIFVILMLVLVLVIVILKNEPAPYDDIKEGIYLPKLPKLPKLTYCATLKHTLPMSVFYSFTNDVQTRDVLGMARIRYDKHQLVRVRLARDYTVEYIDEYTHETTPPQGSVILGEDPRAFVHQGRILVLDNTLNDNHLIPFDNPTSQRVRLHREGKNGCMISRGDELLLLDLTNSKLFEVDVLTGALAESSFTIPKPEYFVQRLQDRHPGRADDKHDIVKSEYRGGTPGYEILPGTYAGFGHRTYTRDSVLTHDIFHWILSLPSKPHADACGLKIFEMIQPPQSSVITDPTCIFRMDGKTCMVTAESDKPWFQDQPYMNRVYIVS